MLQQSISSLFPAVKAGAVMQAVFAVMLGAFLVGFAGFYQLPAVHEAAHDTRHGQRLPLPLTPMSIFRSIVFTAAAAGLVVGLTVTALQQVRAVPLILQAETYEHKAEAPQAPVAATAPTGHQHAAAAPHDHGAPASEGLKRHAYTALFNVVSWVGFGLCLAGLLVIARRPVTWREGLKWGLGGFAAVVVAPSLGLPPELPGTLAADIDARQAWWIGTALATAGGLALIGLTRSPLASIAGAALILAPHLIGAPQPPLNESHIPHAMAREFVAAVMVSAFVSWALLGALTGFFLSRFRGSEVQG